MRPHTSRTDRRTLAFSAYNLIGYGASSAGALLAGLPRYIGYPPLFLGYLVSGLLGAFLYFSLSDRVESDPRSAARSSVLSSSGRRTVFKLSSLFAVDSFGGGFIGQSILSYYFYLRFGLDLATLGIIFFAAQVVTASSFLVSDTPGPRGVSQVGIRFSDLQSVSERTAPGGKRIARTMIPVADLGCASLTSVARLGSSGRGFLPGCPRRLVWTRLPGFGPGDWGSNPHAGAFPLAASLA